MRSPELLAEERLPRPPVSLSLVRDEPDRDVVERSLPLALFVEPRLLSLACCLPLVLLLGIFVLLESIRSTLLQEGRGQEPDCLVPGHRVVCPVGEVDGLTEQLGPPRGRLRNPCCGGWADDGV